METNKQDIQLWLKNRSHVPLHVACSYYPGPYHVLCGYNLRRDASSVPFSWKLFPIWKLPVV